MLDNKKFIYKVLFALIFLVALKFYDTSLPIIQGIIQLKINILGFFLEPTLQWIFDVSLHQAQIIAAWIYLLIALVLLWYFSIGLLKTVLSVFYKSRRIWLAIGPWKKTGVLFLLTLLLVLIGKVTLVFF